MAFNGPTRPWLCAMQPPSAVRRNSGSYRNNGVCDTTVLSDHFSIIFHICTHIYVPLLKLRTLIFRKIPRDGWAAQCLPSKVLLIGDSHAEGCVVPGGFGAAGLPCDGFHHHLHILKRNFARASISWNISFDGRLDLDQFQISIQSSILTRLGPHMDGQPHSRQKKYIYIHI